MVDASNHKHYGRELDDYFRIRHDIYVGEKRWLDLARADGREIDAYDNERAIYLLGIEKGRGAVVAGSRLVSSTTPHLLKNVFPYLAPEGVPEREDTFEWTRFFVTADYREPNRPCRAAGIVLCAILEVCLRRGIRKLSVVCEDFWFDRLAALGWAPRRLGQVTLHRGSLIVALLLEITSRALQMTQSKYSLDQFSAEDPSGWRR